MTETPENRQEGMTLIELSVVLLVLIALAGVALPYMPGTTSTAACRATDATLAEIRGAILGDGTNPGFYGDLLGQLPRDRAAADGYTLHFLFFRDDGLDNDSDTHASAVDGVFDPDDEWRPFNPNTGLGWHGPYLLNGASLAGAGLDGSFGDVFDPATNSGGKVHIDHRNDNLSQAFDAWHRPVVLQVPYDTDAGEYRPDLARLVSAGPGWGIGPNEAAIDTAVSDAGAANRGDDRVRYLMAPDPGQNAPCE